MAGDSQAELLKLISDHLDNMPAGHTLDPKALAKKFAEAYDDPPVERIEAHIIDQMRLRGLWPRA